MQIPQTFLEQVSRRKQLPGMFWHGLGAKHRAQYEEVLISFGEIDCRKDEGILPYSINNAKDIFESCEITIDGYLNYMESKLSTLFEKRYYFGVPAPMIEGELIDKLDLMRIAMIRKYNSLLKKEVVSRGAYFLDVYKLTSNEYGKNNNLHMCDDVHLSPKCLSNLFENHLYKPHK